MARSSVEAEHKVMGLGICELLWVNKVMTELGLPKKEPLLLHSDSKTAINIVYNLV